ncbi:MAG: hypothetical protein ABI885_02245 [Gammaproteobacteria bacterium]
MSDSVSSYRKMILLAGVVVAAACGLLLLAARLSVHGIVAGLLDVAGLLALALGLSVVASGFLTVQRARLGEARGSDLFLDLNRPREADAIAANPPRMNFFRRLWARPVVGHNFLVGDEVVVRSLAEIQATLDSKGELDALPFMPEMTRFCGSQARVFRCADKIYDYGRTKTMRRLDDCVLLIGLRCDGSAHGGCQAGCFAIWKTRWLKRAPASTPARTTASQGAVDSRAPAPGAAPTGAAHEVYSCQFTQLQAATREFSPWDLRKDLRSLVSGNVTLSAFLTAIGTRWFNTVQTLRGGGTFPATPPGKNQPGTAPPEPLAVGDMVKVRPLEEIARTLNSQNKNRGLWFDRDMVRHCGQRYRVQIRVDRIIDAATGRMLEMKSPCIVLEGVECSGEFQAFGAQHEYLYWREAWLAKEPAGASQAASLRAS